MLTSQKLALLPAQSWALLLMPPQAQLPRMWPLRPTLSQLLLWALAHRLMPQELTRTSSLDLPRHRQLDLPLLAMLLAMLLALRLRLSLRSRLVVVVMVVLLLLLLLREWR